MKRWKESNWCVCVRASQRMHARSNRPSDRTMRACCACASRTCIHIQLKVEMDRKWLIKSRRFRLLCVFFVVVAAAAAVALKFYFMIMLLYFFFHSSSVALVFFALTAYYTLNTTHSTMPFRWVKEKKRNKLKNKWHLVTSSTWIKYIWSHITKNGMEWYVLLCTIVTNARHWKHKEEQETSTATTATATATKMK